MTRAKSAQCWAAGAAWFFGLALSGAIGVPFWRDHPYGDGFDLALTAAVAAWCLVAAVRRPQHITKIEVSREGVVIVEGER